MVRHKLKYDRVILPVSSLAAFERAYDPFEGEFECHGMSRQDEKADLDRVSISVQELG